MQESKFFRIGKDKIIECRQCNHFCKIAPGKVGICQAQINNNGKLCSLVYGYPADINTDPVEKKPLYHFLPGSLVFSLGTMGCNFHCKNCLNHNISQVKNIKNKVNSLDYYTPERIIELAQGDDCKAIAYTYNEPTIFSDYALNIMRQAQQAGLKNIWVSNGYMSEEVLDAIIPYLDAINVDLKSIDSEFYKDNCEAKLNPVLKNLIRLKKEQIHIEITSLIIPGLSSDIEMLAKIADFIATELDADTPWHISRFSPEISWTLKDLEQTGDDLIYEAHAIGKEAGLKYVYVGNIPGDQKENTYCPKCGELAIRRLGYQIDRLDNNGRCAYCDKNLDIIE